MNTETEQNAFVTYANAVKLDGDCLAASAVLRKTHARMVAASIYSPAYLKIQAEHKAARSAYNALSAQRDAAWKAAKDARKSA